MISGPPEPADEEHNQPPYTELGRGRPSVFTGKSGSESTTRESESIYVVTHIEIILYIVGVFHMED